MKKIIIITSLLIFFVDAQSSFNSLTIYEIHQASKLFEAIYKDDIIKLEQKESNQINKVWIYQYRAEKSSNYHVRYFFHDPKERPIIKAFFLDNQNTYFEAGELKSVLDNFADLDQYREHYYKLISEDETYEIFLNINPEVNQIFYSYRVEDENEILDAKYLLAEFLPTINKYKIVQSDSTFFPIFNLDKEEKQKIINPDSTKYYFSSKDSLISDTIHVFDGKQEYEIKIFRQITSNISSSTFFNKLPGKIINLDSGDSILIDELLRKPYKYYYATNDSLHGDTLRYYVKSDLRKLRVYAQAEIPKDTLLAKLPYKLRDIVTKDEINPLKSNINPNRFYYSSEDSLIPAVLSYYSENIVVHADIFKNYRTAIPQDILFRDVSFNPQDEKIIKKNYKQINNEWKLVDNSVDIKVNKNISKSKVPPHLYSTPNTFDVVDVNYNDLRLEHALIDKKYKKKYLLMTDQPLEKIEDPNGQPIYKPTDTSPFKNIDEFKKWIIPIITTSMVLIKVI